MPSGAARAGASVRLGDSFVIDRFVDSELVFNESDLVRSAGCGSAPKLDPRAAFGSPPTQIRSRLEQAVRQEWHRAKFDQHRPAHALNIYISAEVGERGRMDRSVATLVELGDSRQRLNAQWVARHGEAMLAILDGNFQTAEKLAQGAGTLRRRSGQSRGWRQSGAWTGRRPTAAARRGSCAWVIPVGPSPLLSKKDEEFARADDLLIDTARTYCAPAKALAPLIEPFSLQKRSTSCPKSRHVSTPPACR